MDARRTYREGLTTVELLIVLAIVGLLATLTIPAALQFAGSPNRSVEQGARDLYTILRAAKIYATTHSVETAVVYTLAHKKDSVATGADRYVSDKYAVVRKFKPDELNARGLGGQDVFVPLTNEEGGFQSFASNTCLVGREITDDPSVENWLWFSDFGNNYLRFAGMEAVNVFDEVEYVASGGATVRFLSLPDTYDLGDPDGPSAPLPISGQLLGKFPAHVFTAGGEVKTDSTAQRVVLRMALSPDADPADREQRIADPDSGLEVEIHSRVELYTAQGRVKISS